MSKKVPIYLSKKTLIELVEPYDLEDVLKSLKKNKLVDSFKIQKYVVRIETQYQDRFEISSFFADEKEVKGGKVKNEK